MWRVILDVQNGVSFNGTSKPYNQIRSLLLKQASVFGNPIYLDSKVWNVIYPTLYILDIIIYFVYPMRYNPIYVKISKFVVTQR